MEVNFVSDKDTKLSKQCSAAHGTHTGYVHPRGELMKEVYAAETVLLRLLHVFMQLHSP